jgi:hypothetical protein
VQNQRESSPPELFANANRKEPSVMNGPREIQIYIFSLARREKFGKYLCEKSMEKIFMSSSWWIQNTT